MSIFYYQLGDRVIERDLPSPADQVLPGVYWGYPETAFTPAYWVTQYWMRELVIPPNQRIGASFREEVIACLLGGYGIRAEVGVAAFRRLRERNLIDAENCDIDDIIQALREPLTVDGRTVRYRFWLQKARYVHFALRFISTAEPPMENPLLLRAYLLEAPGIGPKTASWIVRNWLDTDGVAILDIHIVRAGIYMGLFAESDNVSNQYFQMERKFLELATAMDVPARRLDALIWSHMRHSPPSRMSVDRTVNGPRVFTPVTERPDRSAQLRLPD